MTDSMEGNGGATEHPVWEGAVVGFVAAFEMGMIPRDERALGQAGQVIVELLKSEMLSDLGELQEYLEERQSTLQLTAMHMDVHVIPAGTECLDPVTHEPKGHWLSISLGTGGEEGRKQREYAELSSDENVDQLRKDTGMLMVRPQ